MARGSGFSFFFRAPRSFAPPPPPLHPLQSQTTAPSVVPLWFCPIRRLSKLQQIDGWHTSTNINCAQAVGSWQQHGVCRWKMAPLFAWGLSWRFYVKRKQSYTMTRGKERNKNLREQLLGILFEPLRVKKECQRLEFFSTVCSISSLAAWLVCSNFGNTNTHTHTYTHTHTHTLTDILDTHCTGHAPVSNYRNQEKFFPW